MTEDVKISKENGVLHIRLTRQNKKNALTMAMYAAMADAVVAAEEDMSVAVIVFSGEGGSFTAGNDLKDFQQNPPLGQDAPVYRFILALAKSTVPMIAAVDGFAVGIGTTMLLHCDLVYVGENVRLQMPFLDLGLVPEAGSTYLLPKLMGYTQAAELLLLSQVVDCHRAVSLGLASAVVASDALLEKALASAAVIAAKPPSTVRKTKQLLKADRDTVLQTIDRESAIFSQCLKSEECGEALSAFLEKRKPDFSRFR